MGISDSTEKRQASNLSVQSDRNNSSNKLFNEFEVTEKVCCSVHKVYDGIFGLHPMSVAMGTIMDFLCLGNIRNAIFMGITSRKI